MKLQSRGKLWDFLYENEIVDFEFRFKMKLYLYNLYKILLDFLFKLWYNEKG